MKDNLIVLIPIFFAILGVMWGFMEMLPRVLLPKDMPQDTTTEEKRGRQLVQLIIALLFATIGTSLINNKLQYQKSLKMLRSMNPHQVTTFRVYPRTRLSEPPIVFNPPDPIVDEFFHALTDLRSCSTRGTVASDEHRWFLEVAAGDDLLHIGFVVPYKIHGILSVRKGGDIVWGNFYTIERKHSYGGFQSRLLFEWYQKYSYRWLQPAPQQNTGG